MSAAVVAVVLCGLVVVGLAAADPTRDPGELVDTSYTPVPNPTGAKDLGWRQFGGAVFDSDVARGQARGMGYTDTGHIPHTVDFFSVAFFASDQGIAAGAACREDIERPSDAQLKSCPRVPIIYEYARPNPSSPPEWSELYRGDETEKGFVGAVAWVGPEKAVAVGGSGCYPRREVVPQLSNEPANVEDCGRGVNEAAAGDGRLPGRNEQIAGDARAWVIEPTPSGDLGVRSISEDLPIRMTGLTALAFSPRSNDCRGANSECGVAGGLGQIWTWKDGAFVEPADRSTLSDDTFRLSEYLHATTGSPEDAPTDTDFAFRVRGLAFRPGGTRGLVAVTSGCCWESRNPPLRDPRINHPRYMEFNFQPATRRWQVVDKFGGSQVASVPRRTRTLPDSLYAVSYAVGLGAPSVVATTGSPEPADTATGTDPMSGLQPASRVIGTCASFLTTPLTEASQNGSGAGGSDTLRQYPELSSVRLVAGDDGGSGHQPALLDKLGGVFVNVTDQNATDGTRPDCYMDWAVGEWSSNGQAVAYTTTKKNYSVDAPYPLACPNEYIVLPQVRVTPGCKPDPQATDQVPSDHVYLLPSYPLNAFDTVGETGTAWAAGDRGALLRVGSGDAAAVNDAGDPPKLGSGESTRLSSREAYDAFRPTLSDEVGLVPPLGAQPLTRVQGPELQGWGSPSPGLLESSAETVDDIAMSRDGTEGWALGPHSDNNSSLPGRIYHFDGTRWNRCDPTGLEGLLPADPACEGLRELASQHRLGAQFIAMARVPTEAGDDGASANDFEVVAVATDRSNNESIVRYRDGKWSIDREWSEQLRGIRTTNVELEFATPDHAWLLANAVAQGTEPQLFRLKAAESDNDGEWVECTPQNSATQCLDSDSVLPTVDADATVVRPGVRGLRLTSVGTRVYLYGTRRTKPELLNGVLPSGTDQILPAAHYPVILSVDPAEGDSAVWRAEYDPKNACAGGCTAEQGVLNALSIARPSDGTAADDTGWGVGYFGPSAGAKVVDAVRPLSNDQVVPLLRLVDPEPTKRRWEPVRGPGTAAHDYLLPATADQGGERLFSEIVALPGERGSGSAVATQVTGGGAGLTPQHPMVWLNPRSGRWEAFATPFSSSDGVTDELQHASVSALRPDGRGGLWVVAAPRRGGGPWFYRFGNAVRPPVFREVAHPVREVITSSASGDDGSFWVAGESGTVYRYDRMSGWDRVAVKGWDAGGVVQSPAYAIAIGRGGEGLIVGKAGRIAQVGPRSVALDPSAVRCSANPEECPTKRTLRAVAIASDGSALAGGDGRALVWRPSGSSFRAIAAPDISASATITGIAMPAPDRAWLTTDTGDVLRGTLAGSGWSWRPEAVDAGRRTLARNASGSALPLRAIAVDESGHGYAVGDRGVILERSTDGSWRRLGGYLANLLSVTLGPRGKGALIGGQGGLILTRVGERFEVARHDDYFDPIVHGPTPGSIGGIVGVGLAPGAQAGQVEAWAVAQARVTTIGGRRPPPGAVLHYTSDPDDPLLAAGAARAKPLPDAPARVEGELVLAAFGKSDCQATDEGVCTELTGTALTNDVILRRVRDALLREGERPDVALFTGDASDVGGSRDKDAVAMPTRASAIHARWWELVGAPLNRQGVPLYGALGGQDLSHTQSCDPVLESRCTGTRSTRQKAGLNLAWRQAMAEAPEPWGSSRPRSQSGLTFSEVGALGVEPQGGPTAGARTHYALDVRRNGKDVLRLVVLDTSLKAVSGTAALQNPVRDQLAWLEDVLQREREPDQPAVVVSETPSYAYDARAGATTDTLVDSAAFETILVKNRVTAVVSGRLGWNGLYWLVAPGLHSPCPGGSYQADPPRDASALCQGSGGPTDAGDRLAGQLEEGLGRPVPKPSKLFQEVGGQLANIPVAVAASAGGKFGPNGEGGGSGSQGFWRGYTRIRVFPGRDLVPVVEQRPVFDWVGLHANEHTLTPGRRMTLRGSGREPLGLDRPARYVDIDGPAITHRYDLVLADPQRPYLPKIDATSDHPNDYVPVPDYVGASVDRQTGVVRYGGRGNHPPIYALAILSVGDQVATWPIVFAPRRSFKAPPPPRSQRIVLPPPARALGTPVAGLPAPPQTPIPQPPSLQLTFPPSPTLPNLQLNAPQTQPPPPPPPPPPPVSPAASALQITPTAVGLNVAPAATVIPPPAPPIQPAPPGGARREARQRQAAAAKSEEGGDQTQGQEAGGGENTQGATRHDLPRDLAFTAHEERAQASGWTRNLLYVGGLGVAALTLALGHSLLRPGPRRRAPDLPAPAWAQSTARRRD